MQLKMSAAVNAMDPIDRTTVFKMLGSVAATGPGGPSRMAEVWDVHVRGSSPPLAVQ